MPETCDRDLRIVGLSGSIRPGSYTRMAVEIALSGAAELGVQTEVIDLQNYQLGFAGGGGKEPAADVVRLRERFQAAHGILLGTPEYHGSVSGVLKNALDWLTFAEFDGKMVGLIGVSGGRMGAFEALTALRTVGRALHAWVIPGQVAVPEAWKAFDAEGKMKDAELAERVRELGREVARFAHLHKCAAAHDFIKGWEKAMKNPGVE